MQLKIFLLKEDIAYRQNEWRQMAGQMVVQHTFAVRVGYVLEDRNERWNRDGRI
jgi:hypothetical protein